MIESFIGKLALGALWGRVKGNAVHDWQAIPPKWRKALLFALVAGAAFFLHQWYAHRVTTAADKAGYARAKSEDAAVIARMRARATTATVNGIAIAQDTRSKNDVANHDIHSAAAAISVRGPGAASCGRLGHSAVSAAGGRPGTASDQLPNVAGNSLPTADGQPDLAAVPFDWLVGRAEQADLDRAEVLSWRDWYQRQAKAWEDLKNGIQSPNE